jgi:hypothetical protein
MRHDRADQAVPRPRLLVVSAVMPFPRLRGQQVRVYNKLLALRERFHVTFLGTLRGERIVQARQELDELVDDTILLPRLTTRNRLARAWHRLRGAVFMAQTGLRYSNYAIGNVDLDPARVAAACRPQEFDLVLWCCTSIGTPIARYRSFEGMARPAFWIRTTCCGGPMICCWQATFRDGSGSFVRRAWRRISGKRSARGLSSTR